MWMETFAGISAVTGLAGLSKSGKMSSAQKAMIAKQMGIADELNGVAGDQYDLYNEHSDEVFDRIFEEVLQGPDYEGATSRAVEDVNQAYDSVDERMRRDNFRYGVDPSSARFQSMTRRNGVDRALSTVSAMNKARREEDDKAWARLLTGADINQGFLNNSVNARGAAMGGYQSAASGYGDIASNYGRSAGNGIAAAGYFANMAMNGNGNNNSGRPNGLNVDQTNWNTNGLQSDAF